MTKIVRGLSLIAASLFGLPSHAGDIFVVAHPSVNLTQDSVQDVFTGEKQFAGAQKLLLVDNAGAQKEFLDKVVKLDPKKYNSLWVKKSFRDGLAIPPVKGSDAEVLAFVKKNPGAIGYVSALGGGVKSIGKF